MAKNCLILGCGYLGRRVATLWRHQDWRVLALSRNPTQLPANGDSLTVTIPPLARPANQLPADVEPIVGDILQPSTLASLPRVDTVLYAIGFDRSSGASMRSVYVDGLANVLERLPRPGRFIYVSSSSVYGQADGSWIDETAPTEPTEESGRIVLEAEGVLRARLPGAIVLRFAGIYGPGRLLRRQTIEKGEPIVGDADKWLNLIHVEDGAGAVLSAEQHARAGRTYNVCDDHPVRRRYFYAALARVLDAPPPCFVAPPPGQPTPPHEKGHRRLNNRRLKEELHARLRYPDYDQGLRASV